MDMTEKTKKRKTIYRGLVVSLHLDEAVMPDGGLAPREVIEHPGGVAIAMEDEEGRFFTVTQWRYAQGRLLTEFPAGKREPGEEPLTTAVREIREETGYEGTGFTYLGQMVPTGAYDSEIIHMYYCRKGLYRGQQLDPDEYLDVRSMTLDELRAGILSNEICDAKTIAMTYLIQEKKGCQEL